MHKVAETASRAFAHFILTTARFAEVGDGRKFGVNWRAVVPPVIQISNGFGGIFLFPEFDVDVADLTRRLDRKAWLKSIRVDSQSRRSTELQGEDAKKIISKLRGGNVLVVLVVS